MEENVFKSKDVKYINREYRCEVVWDNDCDMGWDDLGDHLGTIYSNHRRWNPCGHNVDEIIDEDGVPNYDDYIVVPIYMYEHSGMTIEASERGNPFSCPWDSGCAGLIAMEKSKAQKEYGALTEETIAKVKDYLIAEIHELDLLYTGQVFGYRVIDLNDENETEVDSCWGFITDNPDEILEEAESVAVAEAKDWYRKNGIQLRIPFPEEDEE